MSEIALDFQEIHDDFRPRILRYLTRLVGQNEAEDLTQDVFLRISQALPAFRGKSQLSTWVYRIATNAAMDRLRSRSFTRIDPGGLLDGSDSEEIEGGDSDSAAGEGQSSVELQVFQSQRNDCYQDFIGKLPVNYRTVVALSELDGLLANQIADILGLSLNVVKTRLHRGRARLLQDFRTHCDAEDWS